MTCAACVSRVEKALLRVPGVTAASVNLALNRAEVELDRLIDPGGLVEAVEGIGFGATLDDDTPTIPLEAEAKADRIAARDLALAIALSVPIVLVSMIWHTRSLVVNVGLVLASMPVVFGAGRGFFLRAWAAARHRTGTMDTLVALGAFSAWLYSAGAVVGAYLAVRAGHAGHGGANASHGVHVETAVVIVTLILVGKRLEAGAKVRAADALRGLLTLAPATALRLSPDGTATEVVVADLRPGEVFRTRPGERLATDGEVLEGVSEVDESMVTGEGQPVRRTVGDAVIGGTLNTTGSLDVRVTRIGAQTVLRRIVRMVEHAQSAKAPAQRLADRIAAIFVPIVLALSGLTFLGWIVLGNVAWTDAIVPALAVLVVACPCALGLATPMALIVATGRGAQMGILVRDAIALEAAAEMHTLILDKTGTLTSGDLTAERAWLAPGVNGESIDALVAAAESRSEHPVGRALSRLSAPSVQPLTGFRNVPGDGIEFEVDGHPVRIGRRAWLLPQPKVPDDAAVGVEVAGQLLAAYRLRDTVRPEARAALKDLRDLGITPVIASGDRRDAVRRVAEAVGITDFRADVRPAAKAELVQELRPAGPVAMVGDGVNDAPALAMADLGIAMGTGADVAAETSGLVLLQNDLRRIATAVRLARRTRRIIAENLAWAFGYNLLMIPLAMAGRLDPMLAAGAMALSSVSVVLNSLRLRRFERSRQLQSTP